MNENKMLWRMLIDGLNQWILTGDTEHLSDANAMFLADAVCIRHKKDVVLQKFIRSENVDQVYLTQLFVYPKPINPDSGTSDPEDAPEVHEEGDDVRSSEPSQESDEVSTP